MRVIRLGRRFPFLLLLSAILSLTMTVGATFAQESPTPSPSVTPTASPTASPVPSATATPSTSPTPSPTTTPAIDSFGIFPLSLIADVNNSKPAADSKVTIACHVKDRDGKPIGVDCVFTIVSQPGTGATIEPSRVATEGGTATSVLSVGSVVGEIVVLVQVPAQQAPSLTSEVKVAVQPAAFPSTGGAMERPQSSSDWGLPLALAGGALIFLATAYLKLKRR